MHKVIGIESGANYFAQGIGTLAPANAGLFLVRQIVLALVLLGLFLVHLIVASLVLAPCLGAGEVTTDDDFTFFLRSCFFNGRGWFGSIDPSHSLPRFPCGIATL